MKQRIRLVWLFSIIAFIPWSAAAWAIKSISVQGLLGKKAVLLVDGKSRVVKVGDSTPEGIKLIAIRDEVVTLEIEGKRRQQKMGDNAVFSTRYVAPTTPEVIVSLNNNGLFTTVGSINGRTANFLVDTGANIVTLNAQHAKRLNIDYESEGVPTMVATASGIVKAYRITLDTVAIGQIELPNVAAVVMTGPHPIEILLGMSFLGSLEIQRAGNVMRIKKTW